MATTIKLKSGSGAPLAGDLVAAEPAFDLTNKRLYTEDSGGTVIEVGTNPSTIDINAGTIDGTVIGGSSAAAGTFTTFTSTGIDDNATSTAITIDSSENVGIGTASPTSKLTIGTGASSAQIQFPNTTTNSFIGYDGSFDGLQLATNGPIKFQAGTSYTERMRIDASGNVGIGTSSPSAKLDISGSAPVLELTDTGSTASYGWQPTSNDLRLFDFNTSLERLRIDSSGNVGIGTASPSYKLDIQGTARVTTGSTGTPFIVESGGTSQGNIRFGSASLEYGIYGGADYLSMQFHANGSEAMRIDSSGNLLVSKTSADFGASAGFEVRSGGTTYAARDGGSALTLNRITSDGDIAVFRKDDTTVGSIGTVSGLLGIGSGDAILAFDGTGNAMYPMSSQTGGASDGVLDFGSSLRRFKDFYLSGGVYLGGTGAANHLDDYEEGTWTPVFTGLTTAGTYTYSVQSGSYTKIGDTVTAICQLSNITESVAGSGEIRITGLPFDASGSSGFAYSSAVKLDRFTFSGGYVVAELTQGTAYVFFREVTNGSSAGSTMIVSDRTGNLADIYFTITYKTDS